jgi:hypothetical protein
MRKTGVSTPAVRFAATVIGWFSLHGWFAGAQSGSTIAFRILASLVAGLVAGPVAWGLFTEATAQGRGWLRLPLWGVGLLVGAALPGLTTLALDLPWIRTVSQLTAAFIRLSYQIVAVAVSPVHWYTMVVLALAGWWYGRYVHRPPPLEDLPPPPSYGELWPPPPEAPPPEPSPPPRPTYGQLWR